MSGGPALSRSSPAGSSTESGRQPWLVHGILRTADAASPVPGGSIAVTLTMFVLVYGVVFSMGIYYINRLIATGPQDAPSSRRAMACRTGRCRPAEDAARQALGN